MTLSTDKLQQLIENYAERVVDDMDLKTALQIVYDAIVENMSIQTEEDVLADIERSYGEDDLQQMIEEVS